MRYRPLKIDKTLHVAFSVFPEITACTHRNCSRKPLLSIRKVYAVPAIFSNSLECGWIHFTWIIQLPFSGDECFFLFFFSFACCYCYFGRPQNKLSRSSFFSFSSTTEGIEVNSRSGGVSNNDPVALQQLKNFVAHSILIAFCWIVWVCWIECHFDIVSNELRYIGNWKYKWYNCSYSPAMRIFIPNMPEIFNSHQSHHLPVYRSRLNTYHVISSVISHSLTLYCRVNERINTWYSVFIW